MLNRKMQYTVAGVPYISLPVFQVVYPVDIELAIAQLIVNGENKIDKPAVEAELKYYLKAYGSETPRGFELTRELHEQAQKLAKKLFPKFYP